jgi:hypothetical protein
MWQKLRSYRHGLLKVPSRDPAMGASGDESMNQLARRLLLGGVVILLGGCSDDDGIDIRAKDPTASAGSGGAGAAGSAGMGGSGGVGGNAGAGGNGGSGGLDAGMDTCTPVFLDAGVVSDAGTDAGDAGDAGPVSSNGPVTFAADVYPILRANCVPCHDTLTSGGHNVAAADVNEAYGFVEELKPILVGRVNGGNMPPDCNGLPGDPGCISVAELDLIVRWAAQCFPQ